MVAFSCIPEEEKKEKWFLLIKPLVLARSLRYQPEKSDLLKIISKTDGVKTWRDIKKHIEFVLNNIRHSERIFSRASEIKNSEDPDGIIDDMFSESRGGLYLIYKGFENIRYNRRNGIDFTATLDGETISIEVAYVRGPAFKTQKVIHVSEDSLPIHELHATKLVSRLKKIYSSKQQQLEKHGVIPHQGLILIISDLDEIYEPWLNHDTYKGDHPLLGFVKSCSTATVVLGPGTIYEPPAECLDGKFGKLRVFDWTEFGTQS